MQLVFFQLTGMMFQLKLVTFIFFEATVLMLISGASARAANESTHLQQSTFSQHSEYATGQNAWPHVGKSARRGCRLFPNSKTTIIKVRNALKTGTKLIKFELKLDRGQDKIPKPQSKAYKPFSWVRATSIQGTRLLLLPPYYDVLSLHTLEYGVKTIDVNVKEHPDHCLHQLSDNESEELIRNLVMNGFQNETSRSEPSVGPSERVCTMHIHNNEGTAEMLFWCCQRSEELQTTCQYLTPDTPMYVLFIAIIVLKVLVALYSPRFVPDSLYRLRNVAVPFVHKMQDGDMQIRTVVTQHPSKYSNVANIFKLSRFQGMPYFSAKLSELDVDEPYTLNLNHVTLRVKHNRLLPEDFAPVGLFNMIYDVFFSCKLRQRTSVKACCQTRCCKCKNCYWYMFLKALMKIMIVFLLVTPWLLRLYVYYNHERLEYSQREDVANARDLNIYYPGNMTIYLTPTHPIFLSVYVIIIIDVILYLFLSVSRKRYNDIFKVVIRKCFNDMRETDMANNIGWIIKNAIKPCTKYGFTGLFIGVALLPFVFVVSIIYFAFHTVPTINIILRLTAHLIVFICPKNCCSRWVPFRWFSRILKDSEKTLEMDIYTSDEHDKIEKSEDAKFLKSPSQRLLQLLIIVFSLASFTSVLFVFFELLSIVVELVLFTLMGLILNASKLMVYFSFVFLLVVYGQDCFGSVRKKFLEFNKVMNKVIFDLGKIEAKQVINKREMQKNEVFRVKTETDCGSKNEDMPRKPVQLVKTIRGFPRWDVQGLLLFINSNDVPMIPKHFFFQACKMVYYSAPGDLLLSYLRATAEFAAILCFLMFVFIIVLAFGESYEISATNQMLATTAGGILPFIMKNIVFRTRVPPSIDTTSIHFQINLAELINKYTEAWPIYDIVVGSTHIKLSGGSNNHNRGRENCTEDQVCSSSNHSPGINNVELKRLTEESKSDEEDVGAFVSLQSDLEEKNELANIDNDSDQTPIDLLIDISDAQFEYRYVTV